jgi:hypothetical protein
MLARVGKISVLAALCLAGAVLAGCQGGNAGGPTPMTAMMPRPNVALTVPEAQAGLLGHDANAVLAAFGKPAFVRKEADSELWRYDGVQCAAFFFLYREADGLRVHHVETLPQGSLKTVDETCLTGIKARAGATS